ncbi:aldehyde dehydrogenase (NADP(+)) [Reinekea marina]|uniref:Aldehyde dehydrogenase (NADP(+)) n=1 Tax=Reinekea marina TaxID=1310421 RepID=A0ABV7WME4_9GAMM|nr:aldehyde dehydrogenase (NADP(+)) [Reinekea marina]MDN3648486.1 aldehyde dehydrogenase (NADP(+)) [Reinekea marina]
MAYTPHGNHYIAGQWIGSEPKFSSTPLTGNGYCFSRGNLELVNTAAQAAEQAFESYGYISQETKAAFLNAIADEIDARGDDITAIGCTETGLPEARLIGERGRTCGQLRLFAQHILKDDYLDKRHDPALPERTPLPRPDLKMIQRPIGPVAVFGASNFPLAFSTAGGDTAAALAAGCPVIVKAHPAHPGTAEIIAQAIHAAIEQLGLPKGTFSLIHDDQFDVGTALVQHPLIKAVGFTGSFAGGRALFDLCAQRPEPIPFFGELGSINPVFIFEQALANKTEALAQGWVQSLTMGAGQFCTNPGLVLMLAGSNADKFIATAREALVKIEAQNMLTDGIAQAFRKNSEKLASTKGVDKLEGKDIHSRQANASLLSTSAANWLENEDLAEEVFGPLGLVVLAQNSEELLAIARKLKGQLTCTIHVDEGDYEHASAFLPILERKAGRLLANGFPTGVEVCDSMVHGGPYPASTNFGATSVGTLAIRRFLRPVCYQDIPRSLLPPKLQ